MLHCLCSVLHAGEPRQDCHPYRVTGTIGCPMARLSVSVSGQDGLALSRTVCVWVWLCPGLSVSVSVLRPDCLCLSISHGLSVTVCLTASVYISCLMCGMSSSDWFASCMLSRNTLQHGLGQSVCIGGLAVSILTATRCMHCCYDYCVVVYRSHIQLYSPQRVPLIWVGCVVGV